MKVTSRFLATILPRSLDLCLVAALTVASFALILRIGLLPSNLDHGVAVIYAPWTTPDQTMTRAVNAGARFVRFGGFDFIAVVKPENPEYLKRVLSGPAILVVDPQILAGCLPALLFNKVEVR
jgi:hypothetical protein